MLKRLIACLGALLWMNAVAFADEPPPWLKQAASTSLPAYGKEVHSVTLHDESRKTVEEDGRIRTVTYYAVRILTREGRSHAEAAEGYHNGTGKVKDMRAWLIRPSGEVRAYGKKEIIDRAVVDNDVYNEARVKSFPPRTRPTPAASSATRSSLKSARSIRNSSGIFNRSTRS